MTSDNPIVPPTKATCEDGAAFNHDSYGGLGTNGRSSLTLNSTRAIVAGNAGPQEQCRHDYVLHNNKHMHSHIQATIGRAGSVNEISNHKFLTHSPKGGWVLFLGY